MRYVRTLMQVHRGEGDLVGWRARNLAVLHQKGFTTPLSVVLTNDAFEAFIHQNNLQERIGRILMEERSGTRRYDLIRELILNGEFSKEFVQELVEVYESLSEGSLLAAHDAAFVNVLLSPNHSLPAENREGIILNVKGIEQLLLAIKECWSCLFTPTLQRHRAAEGRSVKHLNVGVLIERREPGEVTAEAWSATGGDRNLLTVKTYYGAIDLHGTIEKDELRLTREYLKPVYQSVAIQTALLTLDEDDRLAKLPLGARGEEQTLNDRDMIELGRLAKKASLILEEEVKLYFAVQKERMSVLLCTGLNLPSRGFAPVPEETIGEGLEAASEERTAAPAAAPSPSSAAPAGTATASSLAPAADESPGSAELTPEDVSDGMSDSAEAPAETLVENAAEDSPPAPEAAARVETPATPTRDAEESLPAATRTDEATDLTMGPAHPPTDATLDAALDAIATDAALDTTTDSATEPNPSTPPAADESIFSNITPLLSAYERVKRELLRRYSAQFGKPPPPSMTELFFELSSEVALPEEEAIGRLIRIVEENDSCDNEEEAHILKAVEAFCHAS